jgi:2-keto-4-pentenoate hydratase/2-oxohepta-3-ene-1,7-dioic acid hydratase in catechol pathway
MAEDRTTSRHRATGMELTRRTLLHTAAVVGSTAVAGCAAGREDDDDRSILFAPPVTSIPVVGTSQRYAVRRIYCVGRNYAAHAREMGSDPTREPPFFFQKPRDAVQVAAEGVTIDHPYPPMTKNYHYEVELVAALGKGGRNVTPDAALDLVYGYAVGLDMTRRDLQRMMGDQQKPWELGKSFDQSAVVTHLHRAESIGHPAKGAIWLKLNGETKQSSDLDKMIWNVAEQIANLSQYYGLMAGDIIYSGTPENVGPVARGDLIEAHIDGLYDLKARIG